MSTKNIATMNIFEAMYYGRYILALNLSEAFAEVSDACKESALVLIRAIINMVLIVLLPIALPISAYTEIRKAKRKMKERNNDIR